MNFLSSLVCCISLAAASATVLYTATPIVPFSNQLTLEPVNVENLLAKRTWDPPLGFTFDLPCTDVDEQTCQRMKQTIRQVIGILERTLILKRTIHIAFSFRVLEMQTTACCMPRYIYLKDDDGILRLYPSALAKQFISLDGSLPRDMDIVMSPTAQWYFASDTTPPKGTDVIFLDTILHEILHGLGFSSAWTLRDTSGAQRFGRFSRTIGPYILWIGATTPVFGGFIESSFDRHLFETSTNETLFTRLASFNKAFDQYKGTTVEISAILSLPVFKELAIDVEDLLTTRGSVAFRLPNGDSMVLETSLYPYCPASTLGHADYETYVGTDDRIMIYSDNRQRRIGATVPEYPVIGPKTTAVLESLGYTTYSNPVTQIRVRIPTQQDYNRLVERPSNVPAMVVSNLNWMLSLAVTIKICHVWM